MTLGTLTLACIGWLAADLALFALMTLRAWRRGWRPRGGKLDEQRPRDRDTKRDRAIAPFGVIVSNHNRFNNIREHRDHA